MKNLTAFCGCSFTEGIGLDGTKSNPSLWVNLVHKSAFPNSELLNLGAKGSNNEDVFLSSLTAISDSRCQTLFVQWTGLLRFHVNPSVELYPTSIFWGGAGENINDVCVNPNLVFKKNYIEKVKNQFFDLMHPHYDIVKILKYTAIIDSLCKIQKIKVFFINGLLPVDYNFFNPVTTSVRTPSDTTKFTQQILNADTRSDDEYFMLYDKIHKDYTETNGINCNWLNLDRGYKESFYLDKGNDDLHPGIKSNQAFADFLIEKLTNI